MSTEGRLRLRIEWGPESVYRCCRYWKLHGYSQIGKCGICREYPQLVASMSWDDVDAMEGSDV